MTQEEYEEFINAKKQERNYKKAISILIDHTVNVRWMLHCLANNSPLIRYNNNKQQIKRELTNEEYELCEEIVLPLLKQLCGDESD